MIVGFNFTKLNGEKKAATRGKVGIKNNVALQEVSDANLTMAPGKKGLRIHFLFQTLYEPNIGTLSFEGDVILLEEAKAAEKLLKTWEKEKKLPQELMPGLLNHILERANIQALLMARDLGLPAPIPLPKVNVQPPVRKVSKEEAEKLAKKAKEQKSKK